MAQVKPTSTATTGGTTVDANAAALRQAGVDSNTASRISSNLANNGRNSALMTQEQRDLQRALGDNGGLPSSAPPSLRMANGQFSPSSETGRQLNAQAYSSGAQINFGAPTEQHLPHEAWHVVQQ
jgi:hypothetical protein